MIKKELIENFRKQADFIALNKLKNGDKKKQTQILNKEIKKYCELLIKEETGKYLDCSEQDNSVLLDQILWITYASYVVMLEARHKLWNYEYMSFTRRIGELWEVFCKIPFYYPLKELEIIAAPKYKKVQENFENKSFEYIDSLAIDETQKRILKYYYSIPWRMLDSGNIKLELDLHFRQNGQDYNCDFKSGFGSNEKGNVNRILLVGSFYKNINDRQRAVLFVRQEEKKNNHYLQTLKQSPFWECYCSDECYKKIEYFTGFDIKKWIDDNIDWENDISNNFRDYLKENGLIEYLKW